MDLGLRDRVVIITGASAGIGAATARLAGAEGARLVLCSRGAGRLDELAEKLRADGVEVATLAADVADPASSEQLRDLAVERFGTIDAIVHGAGGSSGEHLKGFTDESWIRMITLNTLSAVRLTVACAPVMQAKGYGRVVTIASTMARDPDPRFASYGASKAALTHATKAMSRAYAKYGITVNSVLPGLTRSESVLSGYASAAEHMGTDVETVEARMMQLQPIAMGRTGEPDEVAGAVLYLISEGAGWTTGTSIAVDGGTIRDTP
ncbi:SDR family NAD(P)-dependent oxidoreductase [Nocardioides carbamazepini]|uniref:SDR family NAD(P)-dependent oxidoreductase n=1 Tax=Nocardioides carbamazepini TaxID=2854259 RepID=UPI002149F495|nr:SDR family NAD(P)-dependent oxidoreductase [Nocardioides carbamazepini]MCR1785068.1 SDR family NAD(P)-dependent oxidoreductase [Nocardioides carbamazepini]